MQGSPPTVLQKLTVLGWTTEGSKNLKKPKNTVEQLFTVRNSTPTSS